MMPVLPALATVAERPARLPPGSLSTINRILLAGGANGNAVCGEVDARSSYRRPGVAVSRRGPDEVSRNSNNIVGLRVGRKPPFKQTLADDFFYRNDMNQDVGLGNSPTASGFRGASFLDQYECLPEPTHDPIEFNQINMLISRSASNLCSDRQLAAPGRSLLTAANHAVMPSRPMLIDRGRCPRIHGR